MSRSRVFILYGHGLFARGVQSLLSKDEQVEVVGMEKDDDRGALDTIKSLNPDVILVDSGADRDDACLTISEIFREVPGARVISLSVQESGIDIYDKQRIVACGPDDLVRAIRRSEPPGDGETQRRGDAGKQEVPSPFGIE
jgi:DNA-binding NarL/FixJ family response regulator